MNSTNNNNNSKDESDNTFWLEEEWTGFSSGMDHRKSSTNSNQNPLDRFPSNEFKIETNGIAEENNYDILFEHVNEQYKKENKSVNNSNLHQLHLDNVNMNHLHNAECEEEIKLNSLKDPLWIDCPNVSSCPVVELNILDQSVKEPFYEDKEQETEHMDLWMSNHLGIEEHRGDSSTNHQSKDNNILLKQFSNQSKDRNKRKTSSIKYEEDEDEEEQEQEEQKEQEEWNRKSSFIKMDNAYPDHLQFSNEMCEYGNENYQMKSFNEISKDHFLLNSSNEYISNHQRKEGSNFDVKSSDFSIQSNKEETRNKKKSKTKSINAKRKEEEKEEEEINEYTYAKESIESIKKFIEEEKKIKMKKKISSCSSRKCSNSNASSRTILTEQGEELYNMNDKIEKEKKKKKTKKENEKRKLLEGVFSSDENLFKERMSSNEVFFDELKSYLHEKQSKNESSNETKSVTHGNKKRKGPKKKESSGKEKQYQNFNNSNEMTHLDEINNSNLIDRKKETSNSSNSNSTYSKRVHEKNEKNENQSFQEIETNEMDKWENKKRICKTLEDIEGNIKNQFDQIDDGSNKSIIINKKEKQEEEEEEEEEKCTDYKNKDITSFTMNNVNNNLNVLTITKEMNEEASLNTNGKYKPCSTLHSSDYGTLVEGISEEECTKGDTEEKSIETKLFTREEDIKKKQSKNVLHQSNINIEKEKEKEQEKEREREREKQVSQKPRKFRDIFISFIKREESTKQDKKESIGRQKTDVNKKMNKKETITDSGELKNVEPMQKNNKNKEEPNSSEMNHSEKEDKKEKEEKFNNQKNQANYKTKFEYSFIDKNSEIMKNAQTGILNNRDEKNNKNNELSKNERNKDYGSESNSLLNDTSQNISHDKITEKKKPNTLYNNFLESLKDPSCKEVVDKVKHFIFNFPQHLNREQASSRVHNFISETQPLLLKSSIYKNVTPHQIAIIQEGYEKFIIQKLFFYLFQMDPMDKDEDEKMYTKINCLQWIQLQHLEIQEDIDMDNLNIAQKELQRMQKMKAPKDKLIMILNCCRIVTSVLYEAKKHRKKVKKENKQKEKEEEIKKEVEKQKEKEKERKREREHKENKQKENEQENASIEEEEEEEEEPQEEEEEDEEEEKNKVDVVNKYIKNIVERNQLQVNKKRTDFGNIEETEMKKESMMRTNSINSNWSNNNIDNIQKQIKINSNTYNSNNSNNNNNIDLNSNGSFLISKKYLNEDIALESDDEVLPCADEILPLLIYVIIKANPEGLISNILFIQYFRHPNHFVSEEAYSFTQFCSAVEFIKQLGKTTFLNIEEQEYRNKMNEAEQLYLYEVKESHKKLQESARKLNALVKNSNGKHTYTNILHKIESLQLNFEQTKDFNSLTVANVPLLFEEYHKLINMKNDILKDIYDQYNETPNTK